MRKALTVLALMCLSESAVAQLMEPCGFDKARLEFAGTPTSQAECLLRPVAKYGKIANKSAKLPRTLLAVIGKAVRVDRDTLATKMADAHVPESLARLDRPLSSPKGNSPGSPHARYFVIHDTSSPWFDDRAFPADIDSSNDVNLLTRYAKRDAAAHVFVNRRGEMLLGHDFSVPWRATKFESRVIGRSAKGLFLHVELVQPRRRDPTGGPKNDALAARPGFSDLQYNRLALLYTLASSRAGQWLIPAYHAVIDEGLADGHDDPQNFELSRFDHALEALLAHLHGG